MRFIIGVNFLLILCLTLLMTIRNEYGYMSLLLFTTYFITSVNIVSYLFWIKNALGIKENYTLKDYEDLSTIEKAIMIKYDEGIAQPSDFKKYQFRNMIANGIKMSIIFSCSFIIADYTMLIVLTGSLFFIYIASQYIMFIKASEIAIMLNEPDKSIIVAHNISKAVEEKLFKDLDGEDYEVETTEESDDNSTNKLIKD